MSEFELLVDRAAIDAPDCYVVGLYSTLLPHPYLRELDATLGTDLLKLLGRTGFRGRLGEVMTLYVAARAGEEMLRRVVVAGMGHEPAESTWQDSTRALRDVAMYVAAHLADSALVDVVIAREGVLSASLVRAVAEGLVLGSYNGPNVARDRKNVISAPVRVRIWVNDDTGGEKNTQLSRGVVSARRTNWVRSLVELPPSALGPKELAEIISAEASRVGVSCMVWSTEVLKTKEFGGVLGVGQGSSRAPCVVELRWGKPDVAPIALTGKGITFDSGGLNLKTTSEIVWMKSDMASAASVAGALFVAAELDLSVSLHALLPLAENMPGGSATRPGDVLHHPGGLSTEVTNTDCEGRLVLADCLAYLAATNPECLIDVGTLTDAAGLGSSLWAAPRRPTAWSRRRQR
jgi:leucyl aminopeptidase